MSKEVMYEKLKDNIEKFVDSVIEVTRDIGGRVSDEVINTLSPKLVELILKKISDNLKMKQTVKGCMGLFLQEDESTLKNLCRIVKKKEAKTFFMDNNFEEFKSLIIKDSNLKEFQDELELLFQDIRKIVFQSCTVSEQNWSNRKVIDTIAEKVNDIKNLIMTNTSSLDRYVLVSQSKKSQDISISNPWIDLLNLCESKQVADNNGKTKYGILEGRENLKKEIAKYIEGNGDWISICWLIGPAGAGKTHIGWDIACNNNRGKETKIPCEKIYYFDRETLLELKDILKNSKDCICVSKSTLFIIDYVYEHSSTIKNFEKTLENSRFSECRVAILYIERDSKLGKDGYFSSGKKFYVNTDITSPNNNIFMLSDQELEKIMAQKLGSAYEQPEIKNKCRQCVTEILPKVDPIHKRPIFVTFLAELLRDEDSMFFLDNIESIDSLMERYWGKRREKFFRHIDMSEEEKERITKAAEDFPKIILICATALGRAISIRKLYNNGEDATYDILIKKSEKSEKSDEVDEKKYGSIIKLLKEAMNGMPEEFVQTHLITYLEEFCTTHSKVKEQNTIIDIEADRDLLTEWLLHKEYKKYQEWGNKPLLNLINELKNCKCTGLTPLIYRGVSDFEELVYLVPYLLDDNIGNQSDLSELYEIIRIIFKWELERKREGQEEETIKLRIQDTMKRLGEQIKEMGVTNIDTKLEELISKDEALSKYYSAFETSVCYGFIIRSMGNEVPRLKNM